MSDKLISITAQCLCKAHTFTASVAASALPLKACVCHCNSCRHVSGGLYSATVEWPNRDEDLSSLRKYPFSAHRNIYFCATCSSPIFRGGNTTGGGLRVTTGTLENAPNLVRYSEHWWISDTIDGGASVWLRKNPDGTVAKFWLKEDDGQELPPNWQPPSLPAPADSKAAPETTPIRCLCNGVNLLLRSGVDLEFRPTAELTWLANPETYKYPGSIDACDSCRLSFGIDLPNWTFALLSHIGFPTERDTIAGAAAEFPQTISELKEAVSADEEDPRLGTLTFYQSSHNVERYFCSRCSAFVFYTVHDRPDMVDIAAGLLDHPNGARAEGLVDWCLGKVTWSGDVKGGWRESLVEAVLKESEEWRIQSGIPKNWLRVKAEKAAAEAESSK